MIFKYGCTALHISATHNLADIAEVLLEHGADINKKDDVTDFLTFRSFV